jgi:hypothetical protein
MGSADSPISRRRFLDWTGACGAALLAPPLAGAVTRRPAGAIDAHGRSAVILWNDAALQGVRESKLGPPMVARALAIVHTCIYDAWAAYDRVAVGTRLGGSLRRPPPHARGAPAVRNPHVGLPELVRPSAPATRDRAGDAAGTRTGRGRLMTPFFEQHQAERLLE